MSWLPAFLVGLISILLSVIYLQIASANMIEETARVETSLMQSYSRLFDGRRRPRQMKSLWLRRISVYHCCSLSARVLTLRPYLV